MTFRAVSIGFSAAVLALACGSDSNNTPSDKTGSESVQSVPPPDTVAVQPTKPETCDDNPLLAGCPAPPSANGAQPPAATTAGDEGQPGRPRQGSR